MRLSDSFMGKLDCWSTKIVWLTVRIFLKNSNKVMDSLVSLEKVVYQLKLLVKMCKLMEKLRKQQRMTVQVVILVVVSNVRRLLRLLPFWANYIHQR